MRTTRTDRTKRVRPIKKVASIGQGGAGIVFVRAMPNDDELCEGVILGSSEGAAYRKMLRGSKLKINFLRDCYVTSILDVKTTNDKLPKKSILQPYLDSTFERIRDVNPIIIFTMGHDATKWFLPNCPVTIADIRFHGKVIPNLDFGCFVCPLINNPNSKDYLRVNKEDILNGLEYAIEHDIDEHHIDEDSGNEIIGCGGIPADINLVARILEEYSRSSKPVSFDYETTNVSPFAKDARVLGASLSSNEKKGVYIPFDHHDTWSELELAFVEQAWKKFLLSKVKKTCQNAAFELLWSRVMYGVEVKNIDHDTMLSKHAVDGRGLVTGLDFQEYELTGRHHKGMVDIENLENESLENVGKYGSLDSRQIYYIRSLRERYMKSNAWARAPVKFLHSALPLLVNMRDRGIKVDMKELDKQLKGHRAVLSDIEKSIVNADCIKQFNNIYAEKLKREFLPSSTSDLKKLFFEILKLKPNKVTGKGNISLDEGAMIALADSLPDGHEASVIAKGIVDKRKRDKLIGTYLLPLYKLTDSNHILRPDITMHVARSYRSSCIGYPFHGLPKRQLLGKQTRAIMVPKHDIFLDWDYEASEVRIIAMLSGCPKLKASIACHEDIHRRWSAFVRDKHIDDVNEEERSEDKTGFVFALFYGSHFRSIARTYDISEREAEKKSNYFWKEYKAVQVWGDQLWSNYQRKGYTEALASDGSRIFGFRRYGPLKKHEVLNTPVQGTAFHVLLDSLIRADAFMVEDGMKSGIVMEIHDEALCDCTWEEHEDVDEIFKYFLTEERFGWMNGIKMSCGSSIGPNFRDLEDFVSGNN